MSWGFTTSGAETAPMYGPTAHERRRNYERKHPGVYFIRPDRSESKEWECWREVPEFDDAFVARHTALTHLLTWLEDQDKP